MRITTGRVVSGQVVLDEETLPEGTTVTIIATDACEEFELGPADEAALIESIRQAESGATVSAEEALSQLKSQH